MNIQKITQNLKPGWMDKKINFKPEINSTNAWALESINTFNPSSQIFLTDFQTDGHGRLDRKWESTKEKNILVSIVDKKPSQENLAPQLTLIAGLGFLEGLQSLFTELPLSLKWPNDILINGKKVGGILIENHPSKPFLVIGVGLNVNTKIGELSPEVQKTATSLLQELGRDVERELVIAACLNHYQKWRTLFDEKGSQPIIDAWKKKSSTLNRKVKVNEGREIFEGMAVDLDPYGFLVVNVNGTRRTIISGDVTLL